MSADKGLTLAIKAAGSKRALARKLGINPAAVMRWTRVPVKRILGIEAHFGVKRHLLRPELYRDYRRVAAQ
jgi:DNA-binding transcriptional regulator YdaS (Cro superfamily)